MNKNISTGVPQTIAMLGTHLFIGMLAAYIFKHSWLLGIAYSYVRLFLLTTPILTLGRYLKNLDMGLLLEQWQERHGNDTVTIIGQVPRSRLPPIDVGVPLVTKTAQDSVLKNLSRAKTNSQATPWHLTRQPCAAAIPQVSEDDWWSTLDPQGSA
jgi:hypothetical protein